MQSGLFALAALQLRLSPLNPPRFRLGCEPPRMTRVGRCDCGRRVLQRALRWRTPVHRSRAGSLQVDPVLGGCGEEAVGGRRPRRKVVHISHQGDSEHPYFKDNPPVKAVFGESTSDGDLMAATVADYVCEVSRPGRRMDRSVLVRQFPLSAVVLS